MGSAIVKNNDKTHYGLNQYIIDTEDDLETIPTNAKPGSTAFCIEDSSYYMLNTQRQWKPVNLGSGGGGSGQPYDGLIYDGGETPWV